MIDFGCGTGTVAYAIQQAYPKAKITCMDQSSNMLQLANQKLAGDIHCIEGDFSTFEFAQSYDVVVSSLALHHLETPQEHVNFYQKIYKSLTKLVVFITIDVVLASYPELQAVYMEIWITFMNQQISMKEIKQRWLKNHFEEDRPQSLMSEIKALKTVGFQDVDVVYKYYNYAVYLGRK